MSRTAEIRRRVGRPGSPIGSSAGLCVAVIGLVLGVTPAAAQTQTTLDVRRAEASALFGDRLQRLSQARRELVRSRERYEAGCIGKVTTGSLSGGASSGRATGEGGLVSGSLPRRSAQPRSVDIDNVTTPSCLMLAHDIQVDSIALKEAVSVVNEDARRRGVYPGIMRDLTKQYGLNELP